MRLVDKAKQKVWSVLYKFFPAGQRLLLKSGIIWHESIRQRYHVGWLPAGKTLKELKHHLSSKWGFGNHFISWVDEGQVLSWRKLVDFRHQYHLRVFHDGEIRGHFEFTPEAHPVKHFKEIGEKECKEELINFLGDLVQEEKYISHLEVDPNAYDPHSQITIENHKVYNTLLHSS